MNSNTVRCTTHALTTHNIDKLVVTVRCSVQKIGINAFSLLLKTSSELPFTLVTVITKINACHPVAQLLLQL